MDKLRKYVTSSGDDVNSSRLADFPHEWNVALQAVITILHDSTAAKFFVQSYILQNSVLCALIVVY